MCHQILYVLFSAHNWNTLFVGPNAVADAMAEKYGKSKDEILTEVSFLKSLLCRIHTDVDVIQLNSSVLFSPGSVH